MKLALKDFDGDVLIATVGLPLSGKTTWARDQSHPIVCPDAIRLALHGERFLVDAEPMVWTLARYMVHALFEAGHSVVILDACNVQGQRRNEWRDGRYTTVFKVIDTPASECIRRAQERGDEEIISIIKRMAGAWEGLGPHEDQLDETASTTPRRR